MNATLSDNTASFGDGGAINTTGTLTIQNSIVAGNTASLADQDIGGAITNDDGHNLLGAALQAIDPNVTDVFSDNPQLAPLDNYGGFTQTMALLPGSPAIGAGAPDNAPASDQRGLFRTGAVDIGAFQTEGDPVVTTAADPGGIFGLLSLREAIKLAETDADAGTSVTITFDPSLDGATITLSQGVLDLGTAATKAGTFSTGAITIDGGNQITVSGNQASSVFQVEKLSHAILSGLTITLGKNNGGPGGGISNFGTLTVSNSTLRSNEAVNGGGIYNAGNATVSDSTLDGNQAQGRGGGIYNTGEMTVANSTICENSSQSSGSGILNDGALTVTDSTIVVNQNTGVSNLTAVALINTVVAGNLTDDVEGGTVSSSNNVIGVLNGGHPSNYPLAPLNNYGGPTETIAVLPGTQAVGGGAVTTVAGTSAISAAATSFVVKNAMAIASTPGNYLIQIDSEIMQVTAVNLTTNTLTVTRAANATMHAAGASIFLATDQRGFPRVVNGKTDIGAFQTQASPFLVTTAADPGGIYGQLSLREAVNLAQAVFPYQAPSITFASNLSGRTITLTQGSLELIQPSATDEITTINGGGQITISGNNVSGVFEISTTTVVALVGLTISEGNADEGGAVLNDGSLTVTSCIFTENSAISRGGAIENNGPSLTITNSSFSENTAGSVGGAIDNNSFLSITGASFSDNSALRGGGINNALPVFFSDVTNSTFSANNAAQNGAGIENIGTMIVNGSLFSANVAAGSGGGIDNQGVLTLNGSPIFDSNSAQNGGGIENAGNITADTATFTNNVATGSGGGIDDQGTLFLTGAAFIANSAQNGGAIHVAASIAFASTNSTFFSNSAMQGGAIFNAGALNVTDDTITGNHAINVSLADGGGIDNQGALTLVNSIVAGNLVDSAASTEPDIFGPITQDNGHNLLGTLLSGAPGTDDRFNDDPLLTAPDDFGGPTLTMAPLPGSPALGNGGAVTTLTAPVGSANESIHVANAAAFTSGLTTMIQIGGERMTVINIDVVNNILNVERNRSGSYSANTGVFLAVDQRGLSRVVNGATDIGAFQTQANAFQVNSGVDTPASGQITLRQAVNLANAFALAGASTTITFAASLSGAAIQLSHGQIELDGGGIAGVTETIDGGGKITVSGANTSRIFQIDNGTTAVLTGLTLTAGNGSAGVDLSPFRIIRGLPGGGITIVYTFGGLGDGKGRDGALVGSPGGPGSIGGVVQDGAAPGGGAINNDGNLTVSGDTFTANSVSGADGGAIENASDGTMNILNTTLFANTVANADGGAIDNNGALTVEFATIYGNTALNGGAGGINNQATLTLQDTIATRNSAARNPDIEGSMIDNGSNLLGAALQGFTSGTGDIFTNQPLVSALSNYSGTTGLPLPTLALLPGSPALGAGTAIVGITGDERGIMRPAILQGPDIGAFQSQGFTLALSSGSGQATQVGVPFASPLKVSVKANASYEPVNGGVVVFTATPGSNGQGVSLTGNGVISGGVASVTATANTTQGASSVVAAANGVTGAVTFSLSNTAPTAQILAITGLPTTASAGTGTSITVTVKNMGGVTDTKFNAPVTLMINGVALTTATLANGNHTFSVKLTKAGVTTVSARAVSGATQVSGATSLAVTPGAPAKLVFLAPPTVVRPGIAFNVSAQVQDAFGNAVTTVTPASVALMSNDPNATITIVSTTNQEDGGLFAFQVKLAAASSKKTLTVKSGLLTNSITVSVAAR